MRAADFFSFARARHAIHLLRVSGAPEPWTDDPILAMYRFTNVFRELDRTTVWFRTHVREKLADMTPEQQVLGTILFRTLNRIQSGEVLFCQGVLPIDGYNDPIGWAYVQGNATDRDVEGVLRNAIPSGPWVTGAYIVKTPDGMDKLRGALWIVEEARKRLPATVAALGAVPSLQGLHTALQAYPFIGGFTGYEIVSDLRWLPIMGAQPYGPPDVMTWAHAGPGAVRGLNRIHGRDLGASMRQADALREMRELLDHAKNKHGEPHFGGHWPLGNAEGGWPNLEMREIEHTLCEFDKYERVRLGQGRPRGKFR
jgi:hypothetical protein